MEAGRIVCQGSYAHVLANSDAFREMVEADTGGGGGGGSKPFASNLGAEADGVSKGNEVAPAEVPEGTTIACTVESSDVIIEDAAVAEISLQSRDPGRFGQ